MSEKEIIRKKQSNNKSQCTNEQKERQQTLSFSRKFLSKISLSSSTQMRSQSGGIIKPNQPMVCFGYSKNPAKKLVNHHH